MRGHGLILTGTGLAGAYIVDIEPVEDERGFFARSWCHDEFRDAGLNAELVQCNISYNREKATLRGMHFQAEPHGEVKLVRCTAGAIHDVIVDVRPDSPTCGKWFGTELSAENRRALYIPEGFAHGFITLRAGSEVFYQMSSLYVPGAARGYRWDEPAFGIDWPLTPVVMSAKDRAYDDFGQA